MCNLKKAFQNALVKEALETKKEISARKKVSTAAVKEAAHTIDKLSNDLVFIARTAIVHKMLEGQVEVPKYNDRPNLRVSAEDFLKKTWDDFLKYEAIHQDQISKLDPALYAELKWSMHRQGRVLSEILPPKTNRIRRTNEILRRHGLRAA